MEDIHRVTNVFLAQALTYKLLASSHEWAQEDGVGLQEDFSSNITWEISPNSMLYSNLNEATCLRVGDMIIFVSLKGTGNAWHGAWKVGVRGGGDLGTFSNSGSLSFSPFPWRGSLSFSEHPLNYGKRATVNLDYRGSAKPEGTAP